jgi:hypothetical protein
MIDMSLIPDPWWPVAVLAVVVAGDVVMSVRPMRFIRLCLEGVKFPEEWWWVILVVKTLAVAALITGIFVDGVGLAANVGLIAYFLSAVAAHIRARFTGQEFWVNCLGMLGLCTAVFVYSFVF